MNPPRIEADGWCYQDKPVEGDDARKIVSLECHGMVWVGIRAWDAQNRRWLNNGEPILDHVTAWRDLPAPAEGYWENGNLRWGTDNE